MTQETMENLGFTEENSIQTEEERKKELAMKFIKISEEARSNVENYFKEMYKNQAEAQNSNNNKNI
jgi:hypothetical protein